MDTKTKQNPSEKSGRRKCLHAETDSDNTFFSKFIILESTEDTPYNQVVPFHYWKDTQLHDQN